MEFLDAYVAKLDPRGRRELEGVFLKTMMPKAIRERWIDNGGIDGKQDVQCWNIFYGVARRAVFPEETLRTYCQQKQVPVEIVKELQRRGEFRD